jgi:hypothetical protein
MIAIDFEELDRQLTKLAEQTKGSEVSLGRAAIAGSINSATFPALGSIPTSIESSFTKSASRCVS